MSLCDPDIVARDYASETRLLDRRSIYENAEGPDAREVVWRHVVAARPRRVLEVGPGPGELSERIAVEFGADVVAVDVSPRMVELTRARGVQAMIGDVQDLQRVPVRRASAVPIATMVRLRASAGSPT